MAAIGAEAVPIMPARFDQLIADQVSLTTKLVRKTGIKAE